MPSKLTEKQKRFIDYYIETANATESAIKAGYSKKTAKEIGYENLTKLHSHIQDKINAKDNKRIASQDEVLELITKIARGEIIEECVVVESVGDYCSQAKIIEKQVVPKDQLKALEMLSKRYGLDKPDEKNPAEFENDGFIEALNYKANEIDWSDEINDE